MVHGGKGDDRRVIIIGGGASGIVACKEFKDVGYDPIVLEKGATIGGVFRDAYEGITLTSSSSMTGFSDFPAEHSPKMWSGPEYLEYLNRYTVNFGITDRLHMGSEVQEIKRSQHDAEKYWTVRVRDTASGKVRSEQGDQLVICTGAHETPFMPALPGQETFEGEVVHTSAVKGFERFSSKRVVCFGLGESGADLPLLLSQNGAEVTLAVRGCGWVVPRLRHGVPADMNTNRFLWGMPRIMNRVVSYTMAFLDAYVDSNRVINYQGRLNLKHPMGVQRTYGTKATSFIEAILTHGVRHASAIANVGPGKKVSFVDGSSIEADVVIMNTGYQRPGFDKLCCQSTDPVLHRILDESRVARQLFKRCLHPALPDRLGFIGLARPGFGAIPPISELTARFLAQAMMGAAPSEPEMLQTIEEDMQREANQFSGPTARVGTLTDFLVITNDLAGLIGATPPFLRLAFSDPCLLKGIFFGPHTTAQFRLRGPGALPEKARRTILSYPTQLWRLQYIGITCWLLGAFLYVASFLLAVPPEWRKIFRPVGFAHKASPVPALWRFVHILLVTGSACVFFGLAKGTVVAILAISMHVLCRVTATPKSTSCLRLVSYQEAHGDTEVKDSPHVGELHALTAIHVQLDCATQSSAH